MDETKNKIIVKDIESFGWIKAIQGMRKSFGSEQSMDTFKAYTGEIFIGEKDKKLMLKLIKSGSSHRKFLRAIHIQSQVIAPFYWWTEMDTYKIATTRLSSSTMHTMAKRDLTFKDFRFDHEDDVAEGIINNLNLNIEIYRKDKSIKNLRIIKQMLPSNFLYDCILDFNYENFINIYRDRKDHRLNEWREFLIPFIEELPLMKDIINVIC
jgi:hypothetical protein